MRSLAPRMILWLALAAATAWLLWYMVKVPGVSYAGALKPLTDGNMAFDPSLQGTSEHRASPRCEPSHMGGREDSRGKRLGCPGTLVKDVICGIPETASL